MTPTADPVVVPQTTLRTRLASVHGQSAWRIARPPGRRQTQPEESPVEARRGRRCDPPKARVGRIADLGRQQSSARCYSAGADSPVWRDCVRTVARPGGSSGPTVTLPWVCEDAPTVGRSQRNGRSNESTSGTTRPETRRAAKSDHAPPRSDPGYGCLDTPLDRYPGPDGPAPVLAPDR